MTKAATTPTTSRDAELLADCRRHAQLWTECGRMLDADDDDPRARELLAECDAIERRVAITSAHTAAGIAAKQRVLDRAEFDDTDGLIALMLQADAERVVAR